MIEGLRTLPFWQALLADNPTDVRRDCTTCMKTFTAAYRQRAYGCGHEPRLAGRLGIWTPRPLIDDWSLLDAAEREQHPDPVMHCPGYTTRLPEVHEVAMAFPQFRSGYLAEYLGEPPSPDLLTGCAVLERAHDSWQADEMRKRAEDKHGKR